MIAGQGGKIAGGNPSRGRVENDFYATHADSTKALMGKEIFEGTIWECACGDGAMSKILEQYYPGNVISSDLIDRGYGKVGIDFLKTNNRDAGYPLYDNIITNPPFNLFQEFLQKALYEANKKVAFFGKLQALEGQKRATFLQGTPLRRVWVFKKRQQPMRNGKSNDEITGKNMSSTMAFAWFIFVKGYIGKPEIEWL